jgi:hypothetical protein
MAFDDEFIFYPPWDALRQRKYLETTGQPADPGAIPRAETPLVAFGMDSPWDDWTAVYAHRRYLETQGQAADPKLPLPRAKTPWFDDEWIILQPRRQLLTGDRFVPLLRHLPYFEGADDFLQPRRVPVPPAAADTFVPTRRPLVWLDDDWVTLQPRRRFVLPAVADTFVPRLRMLRWDWEEFAFLQPRRRRALPATPDTFPPRLRRALVQLFDWEPWQGLQQRRFLDTLTLPPPPPPPPPPLAGTVRAGTQSLTQAHPSTDTVLAGTQSPTQGHPF